MSNLARITAFRNLPPEALLRLERGGTTLEPRNGAQLFAQGDVADSVYAVIGGAGFVRVGSADRDQQGAYGRDDAGWRHRRRDFSARRR